MGSTTTDTAWPKPSYAWYAVIVLAVANLFSAVDRSILNLLLPAIKSDLKLTDTEMGWITGAAFGLVHTFMILPFGMLADRTARNRIVTFGITFWSLMTAACGFANSFWQLFVARMGVGAGEASMQPAVPPLISDLFPREKRTLPMSLYIVIGAMGSGVAFLVGGAVSAMVTGSGSWHAPIVGDLRPWQAIFMIVGLPGLIWALVTLTVREPTRHRGEHISNADLWKFLVARADILIPHFTGNTLFTIFTYGNGIWTATVLIRVHGWTMAQVGYSMGLVYIIVTLLGGLSGGLISQWFFKRGRQDANLFTMCLGVTIATIPAALLGFMPTGWTAFAVIVPLSFFTISFGGPSTAAMQEIAPARLRGRVSAIYHATTSLLGLSFGGVVVGAITDHVFHDEMAVAKSISLAGVILCPVGAGLVYMAARARRKLGVIHDHDLKVT